MGAGGLGPFCLRFLPCFRCIFLVCLVCLDRSSCSLPHHFIHLLLQELILLFGSLPLPHLLPLSLNYHILREQPSDDVPYLGHVLDSPTFLHGLEVAELLGEVGLSGLLGCVGGCGHEGSALRDILGLGLTGVHVAGCCIFVLMLLVLPLVLKRDLLSQKEGSKGLQDLKRNTWIRDLQSCKKLRIFALIFLDEQLILQIRVNVLILLPVDMINQLLDFPIVISDPFALFLLQFLNLLLFSLEIVMVGYFSPSLCVLQVVLPSFREDVVLFGCVDRQHLSYLCFLRMRYARPWILTDQRPAYSSFAHFPDNFPDSNF